MRGGWGSLALRVGLGLAAVGVLLPATGAPAPIWWSVVIAGFAAIAGELTARAFAARPRAGRGRRSTGRR
jgi:hypothetical protein